MSLFFWLFYVQLPGVSLRKFWFLLLQSSDPSSSVSRSVSQFLSPLISSATYLANHSRSLKHASINEHNLTLNVPFLVSLLGFFLFCCELLEGPLKKKSYSIVKAGWLPFLSSGFPLLVFNSPCFLSSLHWYHVSLIPCSLETYFIPPRKL